MSMPLEMDDRIDAPFTEEQVAGLNRYQKSGAMHPFTCKNRSSGHPHEDEFGDHGVLRARTDGWYCPYCDYTQKWAWVFMSDPEYYFPRFPW